MSARAYFATSAAFALAGLLLIAAMGLVGRRLWFVRHKADPRLALPAQ